MDCLVFTTEKNPHVHGGWQFKPVMLKGHLYLVVSHCHQPGEVGLTSAGERQGPLKSSPRPTGS